MIAIRHPRHQVAGTQQDVKSTFMAHVQMMRELSYKDI